MTDFQTALTVFLTADPAHPVRTIVIAFLVGMLSAAIILLVHRTKGLGLAGLMVKGFAAMLMVIGGINFFLGIKAALA